MLRLNDSLIQILDAGHILIVPSRQRASAVRLAYAWAQVERKKSVWKTPKVLSVSAWLQVLAQLNAHYLCNSAPRLLAAHEEWLLWYDVAKDLLLVAADSAKSDFPIESTLTPETLADALQRSATLAGEWGITADAIGVNEQIEAQWLANAMQKVRERAVSLGATPLFLLPNIIADNLKIKDNSSSIDNCLTYCVGETTTTQLDKIKTLISVQTVDYSALVKSQKNIDVRRSVSLNQNNELLEVARWSRTKIEENPQVRLLIVIPDLVHRKPFVERIFREQLSPDVIKGIKGAKDAFAFEGGSPLAEYLEISEALAALYTLTHSITSADLAVFLESSFWGSLGVGARSRIAMKIRSEVLKSYQPSLLASSITLFSTRPADVAVLTTCAQRIELAYKAISCNDPRQVLWPDRIAEALEALGWPGRDTVDSSVQQAREQWQVLLDNFKGALHLNTVADAAAAVDLLSALACREYFSPSSGDLPVMITGVMEHPIVFYDGIWVCGLQSDCWPAQVQIDPLIPWYLQKNANLPRTTPSGVLRESLKILSYWKSCTTELVLSYAIGDGETHWLPSPLISDIKLYEKNIYSASGTEQGHLSLSLAAHLRGEQPVNLELYSDVHGLPWTSLEPLPGGSRALVLQNSCPFKAYAERRLGAQEPLSSTPGITPIERGNFTHEVMRKLWLKINDSKVLHTYSTEKLREIIKISLKDSQTLSPDLRSEHIIYNRMLFRESYRLEQIIFSLLQEEKQRQPFKILKLESEISLDIAGVKIILRFDRIDQLENGAIAVLDYKSGTLIPLNWFGERADAVQLYVYAQALENKGLGLVEGLANIHLTSRKKRFDGISMHHKLFPQQKTQINWVEFRSNSQAHITKLAHSFQNGEAQVNPINKICNYCALTGLCRRSELIHPEKGTLDESILDGELDYETLNVDKTSDNNVKGSKS